MNISKIKKGFYDQRLKKGELADLAERRGPASEAGLDEEINLVRVVVRRILEASEDIDDLETSLKALNILSLAINRLANLVKTQHDIGGADDDKTWNALLETLQRIEQEKAKRMGERHGEQPQTLPGQ